jgi:DNA-binding NarL/FixJ family response regulator
MGTSIRAGGSVAIMVALLGLGVLGSIAALVPRNDAKALGERFVLALHGTSDVRAETYFASDAQVFLPGASLALSPPQFQEYLERLNCNRQAFHALSPVYMTDSGAGWLVEYQCDSPIVNMPGVELPPQLWMEARIADNTITRLWIHFTVEALARLHVQPDVYRAAAELQGIPVPDGWQDGTAAMLAAAQRRANNAPDAGIQSLNPALIVAAWSPILAFLGIGRLRRPSRYRQPTRMPQAHLLASLPEIHSRAQDAGDSWSTLRVLEDLAQLDAGGEEVLAVRLLGAADTLRTSAGVLVSPDERDRQDRVVSVARSAASSSEFDSPDGLTPRELEVLRLVAAGRKNREIADELVLSVRTVERHITNVYAKIGARGKADATAYAFRHGIS